MMLRNIFNLLKFEDETCFSRRKSALEQINEQRCINNNIYTCPRFLTLSSTISNPSQIFYSLVQWSGARSFACFSILRIGWYFSFHEIFWFDNFEETKSRLKLHRRQKYKIQDKIWLLLHRSLRRIRSAKRETNARGCLYFARGRASA